MNFKLPLIAVFAGALSLTACGGGSSSGSGSVAVSSPASLVISDVTIGTGATVVNGSNVTLNYTISLYSATAANNTGTKIESGVFNFKVGTVGPGGAITGVDVGILGMKVGGHRVLLIPASQAYGSSGSASIPPNSGVVFDMTLTASN